jgi:hypothetical protein
VRASAFSGKRPERLFSAVTRWLAGERFRPVLPPSFVPASLRLAHDRRLSGLPHRERLDFSFQRSLCFS